MKIHAKVIKAAKITIAREYRQILRSVQLETKGNGVTVATWTNGKTAFRHFFRDTTATKAMRALVNTALGSVFGSWIVRRSFVKKGGSEVAHLRNTDSAVSMVVETAGKYPDVDAGVARELREPAMLDDGALCFNTRVLIETMRTFSTLGDKDNPCVYLRFDKFGRMHMSSALSFTDDPCYTAAAVMPYLVKHDTRRRLPLDTFPKADADIIPVLEEKKK